MQAGVSQTLQGYYKIGVVNAAEEIQWKESGSI